MRDKAPVTHMQDFPPCSFSLHCQRLIDVLDDYHVDHELHRDQLPISENWHEKQLIEQLREHVPTCPTCKATVKQARQARAFQREVLSELLAEGEQQVPSTTARILRAIQQERQVARQQTADFAEPAVSHEAPVPLPISSSRARQKRLEEKRSRKLLRTIGSLVAAAAIMLASLAIFAHFAWSQVASDHPTGSPVLASSSRWSSVVMSSLQNGKQTISLYDPQTNKSVVLATATSRASSVSMTPEGVSHNGTKLLYSTFDGKQTTYYLRSLTTTTPLLTIDGNESRVVWSTDDRYVFVSTPQGIERIDVQSKEADRILPAFTSIDLQYYRDGYLYYITSQDGFTGILNRVDIVHGNVQAVTGTCTNGRSFWQSPDGIPVYYVCEQPQSGLFVVNSDGTNPHLLRAQSVPMVGYAADGSPLILASTDGKYQVVKLGADEQRDQVVLDDVVPGGSIISPEEDMAVAPFGYTLVARAVYDDYEAIWYGDLTSGQKHLSMKVEKGTLVGFYGWSRMLVP